MTKRKKAEEERARKAKAEARQAEFEEQLKMLDRYPSVEDMAIFLATPNLMKLKFMGEVVVLHGKVIEIIGSGNYKTLFMSGWFIQDGDVHEGAFLFENHAVDFTAGCRVGDYVLIKGTCHNIKGKDSLLTSAMVGFSSARIHYNYGRLK